MSTFGSYQARLKSELTRRLDATKRPLEQEHLLRADLHCHDHNSNVPDEALGRILGAAETWLPTEQLVSTLQKSGMNALTITNHNNARSCWELLDKGEDVLPGAEFSCHIPDLDVGVHVLTYGFTLAQEERLKVLRRDIYDFLEFTSDNDIPTVLAHPLDFYAPNGLPDLERYEKIFLLFSRFEVLNGQRDTWSSILTWDWVQSMNQEKIEELEKRFSFSSKTFCREPYKKIGVGGSDDHFGVFAGRTGTLFSTAHLSEVERKSLPPSQQLLSALREGQVAPFGEWNDGRKLNLALLDYFAGLVLNHKDPGLGRILLHKGTPWQKFWALTINNAIHEIRRHKYTMRFIKTFHGAVRGTPPSLLTRVMLKRHQPELLAVINELVEASEKGIGHLKGSTAEFLFGHFAKKLSQRIESKVARLSSPSEIHEISFDQIVEKLEIPGVVRTLVSPDTTGRSRSPRKMSLPSIGEFFDGLSFPFLASGLVAGSMFATARVLHGKRSFSDSLAKRFPELKMRDRILWLTDTYTDKNGVSNVLQLTRDYAAANNLPIDFLVCHESVQEASNLRVVRPLAKFELSFYPQQPFRIPNLAEIQKICDEGGYTTIVCSTEGPMAAAALYLKHAHRLPVHFYVHTDWMEFSRQNKALRDVNQDRVRRLLRGFYSQFDSVFVLNSEQKRLFESESFQLNKVHQTAHWPSEFFTLRPDFRTMNLFNLDESDVVLIFAGRLSAEKGVFQLPDIFQRARSQNSRVKLVVAGTGPDEIKLKELMPDALFVGWQSQESLCRLYNRADLLLLPSTFDTFGCVVVEAMSCGLPVCAYAVKGPADIIDHGVNGLLAQTPEDFVQCVELFVSEVSVFKNMREHAYARAQHYTPQNIMSDFLRSVGVATAEKIRPSSGGFNSWSLSLSESHLESDKDLAMSDSGHLSNFSRHSNFSAAAPS